MTQTAERYDRSFVDADPYGQSIAGVVSREGEAVRARRPLDGR